MNVASERGRAARLVMMLSAMAALGAAQPPEQRRERVEFDPASGQWSTVEPPKPGTPEGDFQLARQAIAEGKFGQARRILDRWLKQYGEQHELHPHVLLRRAEAVIGQKDYYQAHQYLQEFLNQYGGTDLAEEAVQREFTIAENFLAGAKRRFLGFIPLPAEDVGITILDDLASNYPESRIAELAIKTKADYYYNKNEYDLAEDEFVRLQQQFPRSTYLPYAMRRSADAADASFAGIPYDDAPLIEAQERYTLYLAQFPAYAQQQGVSLILTEISEKRAAKELSIGEYYERVRQLRAASLYYRSTKDNWPNTIAATQAEAHLRRLGVLETPEPQTQPTTEPSTTNAN